MPGTRRLMLFSILFALPVLLVAWIETSTWRQTVRLKQDFAGANLDSFQLGMRLREGVLRLNGALFRYQLSDDAAERENFQREAREVSEWIGRTKSHLRTADERRLVDDMEKAHTKYLEETAVYLERAIRGIRRDTAAQLNQELNRKSAGIIALADQLVQAQRGALDRFFVSSGEAIGSLQRLLLLSVLLLVVLVMSIAALMYRAVVTPLRAQLSENQTVIERQEKLASLGVLATGVAHEIRNPLTAIKFRLFSLRKALPAALADHEDVAIIDGEINRLERIVRDFLQFARPSEPELADVPVNSLLEEVRGLLGSELEKRGIRLQLDLTGAAVIRADRQQLQQVLINLVQNAADSIERSGVITLKAREGASSFLKHSQSVVILEIIDTGKGISRDVEKRIFDPFFSTKESGTGLGLPIAARIVEKHGGFIQYLTQPGHGTTFSVVLPKISPDESAHSAD